MECLSSCKKFAILLPYRDRYAERLKAAWRMLRIGVATCRLVRCVRELKLACVKWVNRFGLFRASLHDSVLYSGAYSALRNCANESVSHYENTGSKSYKFIIYLRGNHQCV